MKPEFFQYISCCELCSSELALTKKKESTLRFMKDKSM